MADFNPAIAEKQYSPSQWEEKEKWYQQMLSRIMLPDGFGLEHFKQALIRYDVVATTARLDYARIEANYNTYKETLDIEERDCYIAVQNQQMGLPNKAAGKLNIDDIKGLVTTIIKNKKWNNSNYTLYELVKNSRERLSFMKGVKENLQDKNSMLIWAAASLKIDNSISSLQNNNQP